LSFFFSSPITRRQRGKTFPLLSDGGSEYPFFPALPSGRVFDVDYFPLLLFFSCGSSGAQTASRSFFFPPSIEGVAVPFLFFFPALRRTAREALSDSSFFPLFFGGAERSFFLFHVVGARDPASASFFSRRASSILPSSFQLQKMVTFPVVQEPFVTALSFSSSRTDAGGRTLPQKRAELAPSLSRTAAKMGRPSSICLFRSQSAVALFLWLSERLDLPFFHAGERRPFFFPLSVRDSLWKLKLRTVPFSRRAEQRSCLFSLFFFSFASTPSAAAFFLPGEL